ncbi:hypothetical protein DYH09_27060 [bacterium CPR1]|nr:hypothetical protein [bacterium CPR1]
MSCQPAVSNDGQAFYGGGTVTEKARHNLVSLDREGNLNWALNLNPQLRVESIKVGPDGTVYALGSSSERDDRFNYKSFTEVHAVTPEGERLWSFRTPSDGSGGYNRFAVDQSTVYLAAGGGKVYALRSSALKEKCREMTQGGQIQLGNGDFIIVGGVKVKVRKS